MTRLEGQPITWVVTGSFGMALQGVPVDVHDIDLQTDEACAYAIERHLAEYVITPVHCRDSTHIRSHFGQFEIDGVQVEVMGNVQKRLNDQSWEAPVAVQRHRHWVTVDTMQIPVFSLEYEVQAYRLLGRHEKAATLQAWLQRNQANNRSY